MAFFTFLSNSMTSSSVNSLFLAMLSKISNFFQQWKARLEFGKENLNSDKWNIHISPIFLQRRKGVVVQISQKYLEDQNLREKLNANK